MSKAARLGWEPGDVSYNKAGGREEGKRHVGFRSDGDSSCGREREP